MTPASTPERLKNLTNANPTIGPIIILRQSIPGEKLRALIFDSLYDPYRGIITYVRVFDGVIRPNEKIFMMGTKVVSELSELGIFVPEPKKKDLLSAGSVGYFVTNLKSIQESKVGDTITLAESGSNIPVPGFRKQKSINGAKR